jgi:hypothetical protein
LPRELRARHRHDAVARRVPREHRTGTDATARMLETLDEALELRRTMAADASRPGAREARPPAAGIVRGQVWACPCRYLHGLQPPPELQPPEPALRRAPATGLPPPAP